MFRPTKILLLVVVVAVAGTRNAAASSLGACSTNGDCGRGNGEFCGVDNMCHSYACSEWYEYGRRNATGYDEASPIPLNCEDIPETNHEDVFYSAVEYRCYALEPVPIKQGFTRLCSTGGSGFTCYEMADSTNFQPFLDQVEISGLTCADTPEEETFPIFSYNVVLDYPSMVAFTVGFNSTAEFNEELALKGPMLAKYSPPPPTSAPSLNPTGSPPPTPTKSSSFSNEKSQMIIAAMGMFLMVSWAMA